VLPGSLSHLVCGTWNNSVDRKSREYVLAYHNFQITDVRAEAEIISGWEIYCGQ